MFLITPLGAIGSLIIGLVLAIILFCFFLSYVLELFSGKEGRIDYLTGGLQTLLADGPFSNSVYVDGIDAKVFLCAAERGGIAAAVTPEALHISPLFFLKRRDLTDIDVTLSTPTGPLKLETSYLSRRLTDRDLLYFRACDRLLHWLRTKPDSVLFDGSSIFIGEEECGRMSAASEYISNKMESVRRLS
jgi:hypothetical protein